MTKKSRALLIALGALAVLGGAFAAVRLGSSPDEAAEAPVERMPYLLDLPTADVRAIELDNPSGSLRMASVDGQAWTVEGVGEHYVLDALEARSVIAGLASVPSRELIAESPDDPAVFGLDPPEARARIRGADGEWQEMLVGFASPSGSGRYARTADSPAVYIVDEWRALKAFSDPTTIRDRSLPEPDPASLRTFVVRHGGGETTATPPIIENPYAIYTWPMEITDPWSGRYPVDAFRLSSILEETPLPTAVDAWLDGADPGDPAYGLGDGADLLVAEDSEGLRLDLRLGSPDGEGRRYGVLGDADGPVFLIEESALGILGVDPFDITSRYLFQGAITRTARVQIRTDEGLVTMERTERGDEVDEQDNYFEVNGFEVPALNYTQTFQKLIALRWEGVAEENPRLGEPAIRMVYSHVDPEVPSMTIRFWEYDDNYYLAATEGEPMEFIIGRYVVDDAIEAVRVLAQSPS